MKKINAKDRILDTAWKLFREKGYENTTLQDIIDTSDTSRGAFYHHFRGKEELLFSMAGYFDKKYEGWLEKCDPELDAIEKLRVFNEFSMGSVENSEFLPFLQQLYGYEVMTEFKRYILDEERPYFKIILNIMTEGKRTGVIKKQDSPFLLARSYAGLQRGLTYNWLLENFRYSLLHNARLFVGLYLDNLREEDN